MCLAQGRVRGVGADWVRGLGLGFTNPGGTEGSVFWLWWCGGSWWVAWARIWEGGVVLRLCLL